MAGTLASWLSKGTTPSPTPAFTSYSGVAANGKPYTWNMPTATPTPSPGPTWQIPMAAPTPTPAASPTGVYQHYSAPPGTFSSPSAGTLSSQSLASGYGYNESGTVSPIAQAQEAAAQQVASYSGAASNPYLAMAQQIYGDPQRVAYTENPLLGSAYNQYVRSLQGQQSIAASAYHDELAQLKGMYRYDQADPYADALRNRALQNVVNQEKAAQSSNKMAYGYGIDQNKILQQQVLDQAKATGAQMAGYYTDAANQIGTSNAEISGQMGDNYGALGLGGAIEGDALDYQREAQEAAPAEAQLAAAIGQIQSGSLAAANAGLLRGQAANSAQLSRDSAGFQNDITQTAAQRDYDRRQKELDAYRAAVLGVTGDYNQAGQANASQQAQAMLELGNARASDWRSASDANQSAKLANSQQINDLASQMAIAQWQKSQSGSGKPTPAPAQSVFATASQTTTKDEKGKAKVGDGWIQVGTDPVKGVPTKFAQVNADQLSSYLQGGIQSAYQDSTTPEEFRLKLGVLYTTQLTPEQQLALTQLPAELQNPTNVTKLYYG